MSETKNQTTESRSSQPVQAAAHQSSAEGISLPAVETAGQEQLSATGGGNDQGDEGNTGNAVTTAFQLKQEPKASVPTANIIAFHPPVQKKESNADTVQLNGAGVQEAEAPPGAPREAWAAPQAAPQQDVPGAPQGGGGALASIGALGADYIGPYRPGMAMLEGAGKMGEAGLAGMKKSGSLALSGAENSLGLAKEGIVGSAELAWAGAKKSGSLGLAGAEKSLSLAGKGIVGSGELALAGAKKSGKLGLAGASKSLELAGKGIVGSGELALAGAKKSGKLGLAGAKKSLALGGAGMKASGKLFTAPAKWADDKMAGTNSKLKKAAYYAAGKAGQVLSIPAVLAGGVGSAALGASGALLSGAAGLTGAALSGGAGLTGAALSGGAGLAGAALSGGAGLTGAALSGGAGLTGAALSGGAGLTGAALSGGAGLTGAALSGGAGLTGAALSGGAGLTGAALSGGAGLTGAALAGSAGLAGAATGAGLGATGMLLGGMYEAGGKAKDKVANNVNKELLGIYKGGVSHPTMGDNAAGNAPGAAFHDDKRRVNYGAVSAKEGVQYGMLGAGGASTVGATVTDMASKGNVVGASIAENKFVSPLAGASDAFGAMGAGAGLLGAGASLVDAKGAYKESRDSSNDDKTRNMARMQAASGVADATKSTATAAYNIAGLVDAHGAAFAGAQVAAGGAAIATGAIDMIRAGYGYKTASQRTELLQGIKTGAEKDGNKEVANIASDAIATQDRAKISAVGTGLKGAASVAGGILLVAAISNPIGWMILGAGALVGLAAVIISWKSKKNKKKAVVERELGITQGMKDEYKGKVKAVEDKHGPLTKKRKEEMAKLGPKPLLKALKENGFTSIGHCYSNYMNATANKIYTSGVIEKDPQFESIITSIGLKVERPKGKDSKEWKPTPDKIAKALTG